MLSDFAASAFSAAGAPSVGFASPFCWATGSASSTGAVSATAESATAESATAVSATAVAGPVCSEGGRSGRASAGTGDMFEAFFLEVAFMALRMCSDVTGRSDPPRAFFREHTVESASSRARPQGASRFRGEARGPTARCSRTPSTLGARAARGTLSGQRSRLLRSTRASRAAASDLREPTCPADDPGR